MTLVRALKDGFAQTRAREQTTARIRRYMTERLEQDYQRSTVQNEVATLRAAFRLVVSTEPVPQPPRLHSHNRIGF